MMTWSKLDCASCWHPKVLRVGNEAWGAFLRMVSHCALQLTDGVIDHRTALVIAGRQKVLDKLVAGGLLELDGDQLRVHDYLSFNASRAQVTAKREAKTERQSRWRKKGGSNVESAPIAGKSGDVDASTERLATHLQPVSGSVSRRVTRRDSDARVDRDTDTDTDTDTLSSLSHVRLERGVRGTEQPTERERRADVEAVAERGRLIDPALDREPSSAPPEPSAPSVRLVVDLLNDGSRGAFALVVDSNSTRLLTAKIRELFDGADAIDVEDYATLALWACPKIGNGLSWATSKGEAVSAAWLVNGSNLANAVGQALAWWRRTGHRQHRAALDELLTRHGVEPADELESDDGDAGEEHVPRAPEAPAPPPAPTVNPAIARERMRAAQAALAAAGSAQPSRTAAPSVDPRPSARTSERLNPAAGTGRPLLAEDAEAAAAKIEARRLLLRAQLEEAAAREAEQTSIRPSAAKVQPEEPESAWRAAGGER